MLNSLLCRLKEVYFKGSSFNRNVILLTTGAATSQGITILAQPILTRLYTPTDFGVLQVYISVVSLLAVTLTLRYEYAIGLPEDDESAANVLVLSLLVMISMAGLYGAGLGLLSSPIIQWTNTPELRSYLWLIPVGLLGAGAYNVISYWTVRQKAFQHIVRTKFSQALWQAAIQIGFGIFHTGPLGLLLGDVAGRTAGSGSLTRLTWRQHQAAMRQVSLKGIRQAAIRYRRFPLITGISALLKGVGGQVPPLLIGALYGPQVLGWFALGQRLLVAPIALVGQAVSQVYLGEAPQLARRHAYGLRQLYIGTAKRLLLLGVGPTVVLTLGGPWLFSVIFGSVWRESGVYVQILSAAFLVQFVVSPLVQTLNILERQDLQLIADIGHPAITIGSLLIAGTFQLSPVAAMGLYSMATSATYVGLFMLTLWAIRHKRTLMPSTEQEHKDTL